MPPCATRSASQYPGGGDPQSLNVRTGTCRRTALEKPARRRRPPAAAIFTSLSRRSIVAALTLKTFDRSSAESFNLPCRSSRKQERDDRDEPLTAEPVRGVP